MSKIIIVGPGGSGKDVLKNRFIERGFNFGKPNTTRPMRINESDKDYNFLSQEEWDYAMELGTMIVHQTFGNDTSYGYNRLVFDTHNLFVMNPYFINQLSEKERKKCFIIYINPPEYIILQRLHDRNMKEDDSIRRFRADQHDFKNFTNYDIQIKNPYF